MFETIAIELYKQTKKENLRLVISFIRVGVVFKCAKTIDCRIASVILKTFKQLSHSFLVLLF